MRRVAWSLVLSLAGLGVAAGQEDAGPEAEEVAPPGEEGSWDAPSDPETLEPLDEDEVEDMSPTPRPWHWATDDQLQLRLIYDDLRLDLEVDHVRGSNDPLGTRQARRRIDYESRHTSARLEAAYGLSIDRDISLGLRAGLGWGTTTITVESQTGSDLSGGGPDFETNLESSLDLNISIGLDARWRVGNLFFGGTYQMLYGFGTFDDQLMYSVVEGQIHYMTHDITALFGVTLGDVVSLWGGVGAVVYWNDINLDERAGADRWDVNLEENSLFKAVLGIALHHGPVSAWVQFQFVPKPSLGLGIGYTF